MDKTREKLFELLLGRKEVVSEVCENTSCKTCQYEKYGFNCDKAILADHLIANDVVPVVRCKDCKHFIQEEHGCNHFGYYSHTPWVDEVDFCSYGERKDNG